MNVLQIYIRHCGCICITSAFDRNLISKICNSTEIFCRKDSSSINLNSHLFISCPWKFYLYFCILCRSCYSGSWIPWISWCSILLPEPSLVIIPDHHAFAIAIITKIDTKSVTCCAGIYICWLHSKFEVSGFIKIKFIWIHKYGRFCSRIISISWTWLNMKPSILHSTHCITADYTACFLRPLIIDPILQYNSWFCLYCNILTLILSLCTNCVEIHRSHCSNNSWCKYQAQQLCY